MMADILEEIVWRHTWSNESSNGIYSRFRGILVYITDIEEYRNI